ncbi:hypothetical protein KQI84_15185 [bacterium]|nr:hypothetical protein [bacterium]
MGEAIVVLFFLLPAALFARAGERSFKHDGIWHRIFGALAYAACLGCIGMFVLYLGSMHYGWFD